MDVVKYLVQLVWWGGGRGSATTRALQGRGASYIFGVLILMFGAVLLKYLQKNYPNFLDPHSGKTSPEIYD